MPRSTTWPFLWIFMVWTFLWGVGEATTPGPSIDSNFDRLEWALGTSSGQAMGVCNPGGVSSRLDQFAKFPAGWYGVAGTHATLSQQRAFSCAVKGTSDHLGFRTIHGKPAPLRPGSSDVGGWTGVLQMSSQPIRPAHLPWEGGEYDSSRLVCAMGRLGALMVLNTVIYLPPRGPTFPNARALGEAFLDEVTREIVYGKGGCRVIMGDFNNAPGAFAAQKRWQDAGWRELQDELFSRHGIHPKATCKSSTRADQIWASPELLRFFRDIATIDIFPDHLVLIASFEVPEKNELERYWQMPERLPWYDVDGDVLEASFEQPFEWGSDSTECFRKWSNRFEIKVASATKDSQSFQSKCRGRGAVLRPRLRPSQLGVPKGSRDGECFILDSLLGRSAQLWFQQMRRFQSLKQSFDAGRVHHDACAYRSAVWSSILRARGFRGGFQAWWLSRKIKTQGVPDSLPLVVDAELFPDFYQEFQKNYQGYVTWQRAQKMRIIEAKWKEKADSCFRIVRPDRKKPLDSLVDTCSQLIEVVDGSQQLVSVPRPFPVDGHLLWSLNGEPAQVTPCGDTYKVDCDLVLVAGQTLSCQVLIADTDVIHQRLLDLWNSRWGKHVDVPADRWKQILQFAEHHVRGAPCALPTLTYEVWLQAVRSYKVTSARGPDGWAREDLLHMPRACAEELLDLLHQIEAGSAWPLQLQQALIHSLEKCDGASTVNQYRPITLMSLIYRVWAGLRSSFFLRHFSRLCDSLQCGFIEQGNASDIWYWVQTAIEQAIASATPACGVVGDLVKAYNTLPREPVWRFMAILGIPDAFLQCWQLHLSGLQRRFVVRNSCSGVASSLTGFPEGCPLSCAGMVALDVVWHAFQRHYNPNVTALSFVDNLELYSNRTGALLRGLDTMRRFCNLLDLELDEKKLYGWSTTSFGRSLLASEGLHISFGERDLGGQMNYGSKLHNKVVTDRIASLDPLFKALQRSTLTTSQRIKCISGALWPRGLHGCESVEIGEGHLRQLRTGAMRGMKWSRGGASPLIRLGLLYTDKLDPGYFQFWRSLILFWRQCRNSYDVRQHWRGYCRAGEAKAATHGPFTKLRALLTQVGWQIDEQFVLRVADGCEFSFLDASQELLRRLALYYWRQWIASFACHRQDTFDLQGFSFDLVEQVNSGLSPADLETLNVVRDGAFFTPNYIAKFKGGIGLCDLCGVEDSREHRYLFCPQYAELRQDYAVLSDGAPTLSSATVLHGLPDANPYQALYWQALQALAMLPVEFTFEPPVAPSWHVFVDGSGINGKFPSLTLTSWAIYLADEEVCLGAGWVPGIEQTVPRAELYALIRALEWVGLEEGALHVWSDCQHVVETFRTLQASGVLDSALANRDLWDRVEVLLILIRCEVYIHKVASHVPLAQAASPLEEWAFLQNQRADTAAQTINASRPPWFMQVYDRYQSWWWATSRDLSQVSRFHLAVAAADREWIPSAPEPEISSAPALPERGWRDVSCFFTEAVDDKIPGWLNHVQLSCEFGIPFLERLIEWGICVEQEAGREGIVSFLEMFIGFRLWCGCSVFELVQPGAFNKYAHRTAAAEFRIFRKAFLGVCTVLGIGPRRASKGWVDLSDYGVHACTDGMWFAWPVETEVRSLESLVRFVGDRPIVNSQGLSRPMS